MRSKITIPPPSNFESFTPSELFRFFFQLGHWTEDSFSNEFQTFTRGTLISTVTINKWKNRDVVPARYSGPLLKMVETLSEPKVAKNWVAAFETVWALHSAGRRPEKHASDGSDRSDMICAQHKKWIQELYTQPRDGSVFSTAALHVPLQFYENTGVNTEVFETSDVINATSKPWIFISGGAGSGKSMSALHMAASLCKSDVFPIFIRGRNVSNIDIDTKKTDQSIVDSFSIKSFLKHFRASSYEKAYLILDGLGEINQSVHGARNQLNKILSDLKVEQSACAAHLKSLHIIVFGRESHISFAANQVQTDLSVHLSLLSLDGSMRNKAISVRSIQGTDFRPIWWEKYLAATKRKVDLTLPDFLSLEYDDFYEFSTDPLLSFLICQSALEQSLNITPTQMPHENVNNFTNSSNKNDIYNSIVEHLALRVSHLLTSHKFRSLIQHLAMAVWQSEHDQSVSINDIYESLSNPDAKKAFDVLGLGGAGPEIQDIAITSFYYPLNGENEESDDLMVEFTHTAFLEYFVSTYLFDIFTQLISAFESNKKIEDTLKAWAAASQAGLHEPNLAGFCQKEAEFRFDKLSGLNWDLALDIIRNHLTARHFNGLGLESLTQLQQSSNLLFFLWSCLNLERQKRNETYFDLNENSLNFDFCDLRKIQSPSTRRHRSSSLIEPTVDNPSFLTFSVSGLKLSHSDMSQLNFRLGHMEHAIFEDTSFAMTHWSHVKASETEFTRSIFQQAIVRQLRVLNSQFSNCLFQGTRFEGGLFKACQMQDVYFSQCHFSDVEFMSTYFENVIFDRCVFTESSFSRMDNLNRGIGAKFRHCSFLKMDETLRHIPEENLTGTIYSIQDENSFVSPKPLS